MSSDSLADIKLAEYNVLIRMDVVEHKTKGGVLLPSAMIDREELSEDRGVLVKASPLAFSYAEWPEADGPPQVGDRVVIAQYDGKIYDFDGVKHRVVKDKSIVAWWPEPVALGQAA